MSKNDYINELRARIAHLPEEERDAALTYYIEYLEEVGEENIQQVIQQLGTPRDVAERIIADYASRSSSAAGQNGYDPFASGSYRPNTPPYHDYNKYQQKEKSNHGCLIAIIALLTSFIWLPILFVVAMVLLGIIGGMIGLALGGVGGVIIGIGTLLSDPSEGIFIISAGLIFSGVFLLALAPVTMLYTRFLPWVWRCIRGKKKQDVPHYQPTSDPGPYADSFRQQNENWNHQEEPAQEEETYRRPPEPEYHSPFGNDAPPEKNTTATLNPNTQYTNPFQSPKDDLPRPNLETPGADAKAPEQNPTLETPGADAKAPEQNPTLETPGADAKAPEQNPTLEAPTSNAQDAPVPELKIDTVPPVVANEESKAQPNTESAETVGTPVVETAPVEEAPAQSAPAPEASAEQPVKQQDDSTDSVKLVNDWDTQKAIQDTITLVQDVEDDIKAADAAASDSASEEEKQ